MSSGEQLKYSIFQEPRIGCQADMDSEKYYYGLRLEKENDLRIKKLNPFTKSFSKEEARARGEPFSKGFLPSAGNI